MFPAKPEIWGMHLAPKDAAKNFVTSNERLNALPSFWTDQVPTSIIEVHSLRGVDDHCTRLAVCIMTILCYMADSRPPPTGTRFTLRGSTPIPTKVSTFRAQLEPRFNLTSSRSQT